jgi:hypothetical protein
MTEDGTLPAYRVNSATMLIRWIYPRRSAEQAEELPRPMSGRCLEGMDPRVMLMQPRWRSPTRIAIETD